MYLAVNAIDQMEESINGNGVVEKTQLVSSRGNRFPFYYRALSSPCLLASPRRVHHKTVAVISYADMPLLRCVHVT